MKNKPVEYVIEPVLGEVWMIHLFPDGRAHAVIDPTSHSQIGGSGEEALVKHLLDAPPAIPHGAYLRGEHPMVIPTELADKMREIQSIEDDVVKQASREPTDKALIALFFVQVAEKIRNSKK